MKINYSAAARGIRCHAGPDQPALAISKPGASSLDFRIPLRLPVVKGDVGAESV